MSSSRQFWQSRRAKRRLPRQRSFNNLQEVKPTGIIGFKAGMTQLVLIDDSESPTKQREINRACTVIEIPKTEVYAVRLYKKDPISGYLKSAGEIISQEIAQKIGIKSIKNQIKPERIEESAYTDAAILAAAYPSSTNSQQNHVQKFEIKVSGNDIKKKLDLCLSLLGKELKAEEVFKPGQYVDVSSITKGYGWQGVIKRSGVQRQDHKATQKIRHVGTLGAFRQSKVMYTVPQAGQMGFNYRTERNKRLLKIAGSADAKEVNKSSGFKNYGVVKGNYVIIDGSIPGPSHRLVRIRGAASPLGAEAVKEPKVIKIIR
ncbi:MAG: 50S ribosomal protein L3 [Candidatus Micrarchaeaceae archaeon]